jgi:hypothetical protein
MKIQLNFQTFLKTLDGKKQLHIIGIEQYTNVIDNLQYSVDKQDETQWSKMHDSTPATVDGVLDQKPSKSPCKRNPPAIPFQLSSAQKKRSHHRSVLLKAMFHVG